jgi:hypothetical protein
MIFELSEDLELSKLVKVATSICWPNVRPPLCQCNGIGPSDSVIQDFRTLSPLRKQTCSMATENEPTCNSQTRLLYQPLEGDVSQK